MKRSHSYGSALDYSYSDKPISLAMIGAGRAGEFHVKSLSINKQFELKYIVDTDEDKANSLSALTTKAQLNAGYVSMSKHKAHS